MRAIVANGGKVVIGDVLESEGKALASELGESTRFIRLDVTNAAD
jgi:3alpha(or 20beta)-hydroxysteroid dehydrogenase